MTWDMKTDSEDNIIVFGLGFNSNNGSNSKRLNFTFRIIKYNKDGVEQWNKSYKPGEDIYPGGIAVDSDDNIILTGGYGNLDVPSFSSWILKMDKTGEEIWNKTFNEDLMSLGCDVTVNSEDEIFIGGYTVSFAGQGWFIVKYDGNGEKKWTQRYPCRSQPYDLAIDSEENLVLTGQDYSTKSGSSSCYTIKCDKNGNLLWRKTYDTNKHEYLKEVEIDSKDNIITLGETYNVDKNFLIIYDKNGEETCFKKLQTGFYEAMTINDNDEVIATGTINNSGNWDFYTCKFVDVKPPEFKLEKPQPGYLYVFNKKIMPIGKNTIIIGGITIKITPENMSDVKKAEFLIQGFNETKNEPPYEYTWDNPGFGEYEIEIHVYDHNWNINREKIRVWKIL